MDRRKKISVVAVVLFIGAALALEFRRPKPVGDAESSQDAARAATTTVDSALSHAPLWPSTPEQVAPPSDTVQPTSTAGSTSEPSASAVARTATLIPQLTSPAPDTSKLVALNGPEQTHTVVDGDTLVAVSARYLGNPERASEIYEFNRDVLKDPDVLPLGCELRIPPRIPLAAPLPDNSPPAPQPDASPPAPTTQTLTIPAASRVPAPRTYTVQPGENLIDIARKLYGDGRKNQAIYEANRRALRSPTDLKPGTVLIVP